MRHRRALVLLALFVAPFLARTASATGQHCFSEPRTTLYLDQTIVGILNPQGAEHQLQLILCVPLIKTPGLFFDYTNFQIGLYSNVSPIYLHSGAFVSLTPLSFLVLRAEVSGLGEWPFPTLDGAAYYPVDGYHADVTDAALPASRGEHAAGLQAGFSATLQATAPLGHDLQLYFADTLLAEYWEVGSGRFYLNERRDVVLAQRDWLFKNTLSVLVEATLRPRVTLRVGVVDDLTVVPASGSVINILGVMGWLDFRRPHKTLQTIQPFLRLGGYTHHDTREGANLLGGINFVYDLARGR